MDNLDISRAMFVGQEYRYIGAKDDNVKARHPDARAVELATNLSNVADAQQLALDYLDEFGKLRRNFDIRFIGSMSFEDFDGSIPTVILNDPEFLAAGAAGKIASVKIDPVLERVTVTVRLTQ